jgi:hypothetical protein
MNTSLKSKDSNSTFGKRGGQKSKKKKTIVFEKNPNGNQLAEQRRLLNARKLKS